MKKLLLVIAIASLLPFGSIPIAIAADNPATIKIDVVGQFIDLLSDLLKLTSDTVQFIEKQRDKNLTKEQAASAQEFKDSLELLSYNIQNSLYNGSDPALQMLKSQLEDGEEIDMETLRLQIAELAAMTEASVRQLNGMPKSFATDQSFGDLLKAQNARLILFQRIETLTGKATAKDVGRMKVALDKWEQANLSLERAVKKLNTFTTNPDK